MKRSKYIIVFVVCLGHNYTYAQGILGRLKQKATDVAEKIIDTKADEFLTKKTKQTNVNTREPAQYGQTLKNHKNDERYDFKPGGTVLFTESFSQDEIGQFPLLWYTKSKGKIVEIENVDGKWLQLFNGAFLSPEFLHRENYTLEFDIILNYPIQGNYPLPFLRFGLYDRGNKGHILSNEYKVNNNFNVTLSPYRDELRVNLLSLEDGKEKIRTDNYILSNFADNVGIPIHVALDIQKERLRLWIDKENIFDLPNAVPVLGVLNQMRLEMESSNYRNYELGYYISNLRLAEGKEDTRSKLLTEGRIESNAILFASNSAKITADEEGIITEIAKTLNQDPTIKIRIIGHTDSDGPADQNLRLSEQRAESVKRELTEKFGILNNRIEILGKGDKVPIVKNNTAEGKAKNRRVEFIKL